ncbi:transcriptional repressor [Pelomyxa schiedti]|nr:transcriptional repressor [Pelomyxa schiedti]
MSSSRVRHSPRRPSTRSRPSRKNSDDEDFVEGSEAEEDSSDSDFDREPPPAPKRSRNTRRKVEPKIETKIELKAEPHVSMLPPKPITQPTGVLHQMAQSLGLAVPLGAAPFNVNTPPPPVTNTTTPTNTTTATGTPLTNLPPPSSPSPPSPQSGSGGATNTGGAANGSPDSPNTGAQGTETAAASVPTSSPNTTSSSTPTLPNPSVNEQEEQLPFQPPINTVQQILNTTVGKCRIFVVTLEHIKLSQKRILDLPPLDCAVNLEALSRQHKELYDAMAVETSMLARLFDEIILIPAEMHHTKRLQMNLSKYMKQLDLYQLELMHYIRPDTIPCPAALLVTDQPFSRSIVKGQTVALEAQLLLPSSIDLKNVGPVDADIVQLHGTSKKGVKCSTPSIENASETIDTEGKVRFHLRFPAGTNKKPVTLRLHATISYHPLKCHNPALAQAGTRVVESNASRPFIITTNSIQWRDSEGILLKMEAFGDATEITWAKFANTLQSYYLGATRQNPEQPNRPLTLKDFEFLNNLKFDGNTVVTLQTFDNFWEWFGAALEKIRHQKNLCPLWLKGYIYGFISKIDSEKLLSRFEEGSFLIRLSDRFPGKYACAYVYDGVVRHSLIKDTDVAGNKRTLVDFLHEIDHVRIIVQVRCDFNGHIQINKCIKQDMLQEFLSEKQDVCTPGYEEFPPPGMRPAPRVIQPDPTTVSPQQLLAHAALYEQQHQPQQQP